ncbi:hypothetical protein BCP12_220 [Bacillus phage BCP12]|uniref:Uncharacterized protein n=3 Tax=Tsarbombavirus BCP78 TaxID=1985182 RepID=A0A2S0CSK8_9CAUD|nr:hypothetical protein BCP12_220 [Bacillus phage BCP12]
MLVGLIVLFVFLYSAILFAGYIRSRNHHRENRKTMQSLKEIVEEVLSEVKHTIRREEIQMTNEKNNGKLCTDDLKVLKATAESTAEATETGVFYIPEYKVAPVNELTLTQLLTTEPTDEDYQTVVELLTDLFQKRYQEYKFLIAKSPDEIDRPHLLQVQSNFEEDPYLHKLIFAKCMNANLDMTELSKRFADYAVKGNVIDLGEDAVIIVDDGTGLAATGVSPINSGLEDSAITYILGFIKKSNWAAWHEKAFPKTEDAE